MGEEAMKRREFLKASAGAFPAVLRAQAAADVSVEVKAGEPGAAISPHLYGHFIEHLGGVIYDGVWVGRGSRVPNYDGIRKDFADDMKRIGAPNLRWPGGCYADGYHWRDGIGAKRPRTYNFWHPRMPKGVDSTESNEFGAGEFLRLCKLVGAEPYLAANLGTGSPREFYDWVQYCNAPAGTVRQADERAANGQREPYNVKYWGVGNESWGCGGYFKPQAYADEYRRYISQLPRYGEMFLIAAGPSGGDLNWTRGFFGQMPPVIFAPGRNALHGWALHYYTRVARPRPDAAIQFDSSEWYQLLEAGQRIEKFIEDHWAAMGEFDKNHNVKLVVDEWGVWYPPGTEIKPGYLFSQTMTLRDALHTGITLDIFQRHAGKIAMANVAQTVNCIHSLFLAEGSRYVRTTAYHVFEMYRAHKGGRVAPIAIEGGDRKVAGSASVNQSRVIVTLTNSLVDSPVQVAIKLAGGQVREARGRVLTHENMRAANTFEAPETVMPLALEAQASGGAVRFRLPAKSVVAIEILV